MRNAGSDGRRQAENDSHIINSVLQVPRKTPLLSSRLRKIVTTIFQEFEFASALRGFSREARLQPDGP
jgi:hypothetical protein